MLLFFFFFFFFLIDIVYIYFFFFFQAEDGIRDFHVTGVQTCALPICRHRLRRRHRSRSPPARAWTPRRPAAPHLAQDACLHPRDPSSPPACRGSAPTQTRLTLHRQLGLRSEERRVG